MKLNYRRTFWVGLAFLSICAFWEVYDGLIPLMLQNTFKVDDAAIGVVMALDNILALFMLPLFGKLSDKTRTSIGRRMPYILGGTFVAVICLIIIPLSELTENIWLFFVGLGLVLVAMAVYRSPAVALMPDITPKPLRSKANAVINLAGAVGGMLMLVTVQVFIKKPVAGEEYRPDYLPVFVVLAVLMAASVALLFWKIKEPECVREMEEESARYGIDTSETEPEEPNAGKKLSRPVFRSLIFILSSVFLWFMGYNAVKSGFSRYAAVVLKENYSLIMMVCTAAAIVSYIPVGMIASRIGRKKTILMGILMLGIAFTAGAFFTSVTPLLYIFFIFAGFGWAFINVNSYPMVVELSKDGDVGVYTGYYYTVSMTAQIITPIFSGWLMDISYATLFPYAAIFVFASFVTMLFVKHGDSRPEKRGKLESFDVED